MNALRKWAFGLTILGMLFCVGLNQGYLSDPGKLQELLIETGLWEPFQFIVLQIFQTVIPIIPRAIGVEVWRVFCVTLWDFAGAF